METTQGVFVRTTSHRSREKLRRLVGELDSYYTWEHGGAFVLIPEGLAGEATAIVGVTKPRRQDGYRKCWRMSGD